LAIRNCQTLEVASAQLNCERSGDTKPNAVSGVSELQWTAIPEKIVTIAQYREINMAENDDKKKDEGTEYFVNGEERHAMEKSLTVGQILERAGFSPASDYELEDDKNHKVYKDPKEEIHVHEKERFTATYTGVTPTS
jgi:hypothetical protein